MRPDFPPSDAEQPPTLTRGQFHRLRIGWMTLGAGIALGTAGGILRNPWLLTGFLICIAVVLIRNRSILSEQSPDSARG